MGAEMLQGDAWEGFEQRVGGNIEHIYNNGVSTQVIFGIPTATCRSAAASDSDNGHLHVATRSISSALFLNDTWAWAASRSTSACAATAITAGCPSRSSSAAPIGPRHACRRRRSPRRDFYTWNSFAPRIGVVYDLRGDGRTVIKANYGLYWHNPGVGVGADANPNTGNKSVDLHLERRQRRSPLAAG